MAFFEFRTPRQAVYEANPRPIDEMLAECGRQGIPVTDSTEIHVATATILAELLRRTSHLKI